MAQPVPYEALIRLGSFVAIFAAMALYELCSPRLERAEMTGALKSRRWFANLSLLVISSVVLRVVFPAAAVGAAIFAEARGWGLFRLAHVPGWLAAILSFVLLDLAIWAEHLVNHKVPLLWRIHRMHHADIGFDVTTGLRFHPFEILLSMLWKALVVMVLGAPVFAVLVFEVVLNAMSMFNHSNISIPDAADRLLRKVVVTPDMHRVHHSTINRETDSNYGFNFSLWDRLFATYTDQPSRGHEGMDIGLDDFRGAPASSLGFALVLPFRRLRQKKLTGK